MKTLFCTLLLAFGMKASAQFTLEQTYDSTSSYNTCQGNPGELLMVKLEQSGEKFIRVNRCAKTIKIYDLNYSLVKSISIAGLPLSSPYNTMGSFLYFSENLFNNDSKLEYMYVADPTGNPETFVYNEDGTQLFHELGSPVVLPVYHMQQYPIYNTSQGTKMIISYMDGKAKVFGLGGTLTTAIQQANGGGTFAGGMGVSGAVPNPTSSQSRIAYALPQGITEGDIVFYDLQGKEIKRFKVDNSFDHILVSATDVAAGTYFYQLQTSGQNSAAKKLVVIQ